MPNKPPLLLAPCGCFGGSGAPNSDQTGLTDLPEDWPAASAHDDTAVTPCKPQSHEAQMWLV